MDGWICVCVCVCVCVCAVAILAQDLERGASAPQQLCSNLPSFKSLLEVIISNGLGRPHSNLLDPRTQRRIDNSACFVDL